MQQKLIISTPPYCLPEIEYSINIILGEFLGLEYEIVQGEHSGVKLMSNDNHLTLTVDSSFFDTASTCWLKHNSLPTTPLKSWNPKKIGLDIDLTEQSIPVLFGEPTIRSIDRDTSLGLDIFGSIFFSLTRYEELIKLEKDTHGRFPAKASLAYQEGYLDRPIVDEYVEILWVCIKSLWPSLTRKKRTPNNLICCDVDAPFESTLYSFKKAIYQSARAVLKEQKILAPFQTITRCLRYKLGFPIKDKNRCALSWIMDINNEKGNKVHFFMIPNQTSKFDHNYSISSDSVRDILHEIKNKGHLVGFHPGYETYDNILSFQKSASLFHSIMQKESIQQNTLGGRQHYLRYDIGITPMLWEQNGFNYDSTLGYADHAGFRCGTSHEYSMYNLIDRKKINLKQRPLIAMECTIMSAQYEGVGRGSPLFNRLINLKKKCHKYDGTFTLLWHEYNLIDKKDRDTYEKIIEK